VDQRLFKIGERRPERLTRADTPEVARAIAAYYRRQAQLTRGVTKEVAYVRLINPGLFDVSIRWEDWVKILPYFMDGSFNPSISHEPTLFVSNPTLNPADGLYRHILNILNQLFTIEFPKST
jgi:hypothetical protein